MSTTINANNETGGPPTTRQTEVRDIEPRVLAGWLKQDRALIVDVREGDEYAAERIEGALNHPLSQLDATRVPPSDNKTLVLICRSGNRSKDAAQRLIASGRDDICHLNGGLRAWAAAGLPVRKIAKAPISIMRQVQLTAGSIVFVATVLGAFVSPWFLLVSGFVGAGLTFAGLSGTCGMASLLSYMPWNRRWQNATSCEI